MRYPGILIALLHVGLCSAEARQNPVRDFAALLEVGKPCSYKGLIIYPLHLKEVLDETNYLSSSEGFERECLVVKETNVVSKLVAINNCSSYIVLLGGESLIGGKQNRTLRYDVLLPPRSGEVGLPTFCVEESRWSGRGKFRRSIVLHQSARLKALYSASQSEVWEQIRYDLKRLNAVNATQDATEVYERNSSVIGEYRRNIVLPAGTVGVIAMRFGRIMGMDAFCNPRVFGKFRERVLNSYIAECIPKPGLMRKRIGRDDPEEFLRLIASAGVSSRPSPGVGEVISITSSRLRGSALAFRSLVIHINAVPQIHRILPPAHFQR